MNINLKDFTPDQIKDLRQQLAQLDKVPHYTDIKSWEDAIKFVKPEWFLNYKETTCPSELHAKSLRATARLMVISEALNKGWKADWESLLHNKYAIKYMSGNLRVENLSISNHTPIHFASREIAEYAMNQFEELFLDMLMIERDGR